MQYKEFRTAAHRHLISCEKMCEKLSQITNPIEKRGLIAEIYYLSGYIVETLLSYAIFSVASRDIQRKPIELHPDYENGFKTHDFQAKIHFALTHGCNFNGLLFISERHSNKRIRKMFNEWKVEMRYQHFSRLQNTPFPIDDQLICSYIIELSKLEKQFNQKFI
jgi:hypothetical protein